MLRHWQYHFSQSYYTSGYEDNTFWIPNLRYFVYHDLKCLTDWQIHMFTDLIFPNSRNASSAYTLNKCEVRGYSLVWHPFEPWTSQMFLIRFALLPNFENMHILVLFFKSVGMLHYNAVAKYILKMKISTIYTRRKGFALNTTNHVRVKAEC